MNTKYKYANGLMAFFIEVSVCFFFFPFSFSSAKTNQLSEKSQQLRRQVRDIYTSQIGIREQGTNSGPRVQQYLSYVNLPAGNPWCAAFVCWVLGKANVPNPRTAWSPDLFKPNRIIWERAESGMVKVESRKLKVESRAGSQESRHSRIAYTYPNRQTTDNRQQATPSTGDIFGIYFPDKKRIAHVGFVDQWEGTWLLTVEGNTNASGSNEGDGVYRKRRLVKSVYKVSRYINH